MCLLQIKVTTGAPMTRQPRKICACFFTRLSETDYVRMATRTFNETSSRRPVLCSLIGFFQRTLALAGPPTGQPFTVLYCDNQVILHCAAPFRCACTMIIKGCSILLHKTVVSMCFKLFEFLSCVDLKVKVRGQVF